MPETKTDLKRAYDALSGKTESYKALFDYYDGNQELKYNTTRFLDIFKSLDTDFTENWCAVVIDSCYNRVNLVGAELPSEEEDLESGWRAAVQRLKEWALGKQTGEQDKLNKLLEENEVLLESDIVHQVAGVIGESFYFVWKNEKGITEGFYNDPRLAHVFYDDENPRKKDFAAKWWETSGGTVRLNLYYADRLEFYSTEIIEQVTVWTQFMPCDQNGIRVKEGMNEITNEWEIVPVFHFRPDRRKIKSDLKNVIAPQDAINKLVADLMIVSEFGAFRQRWIISDSDIKNKLKNAPNEIWSIPAGSGEGQGSSVGELEGTDPERYMKPIERQVNAVSSITSTPKHFFFSTTGVQISGEALIALEAPLNDKAQSRIDIFSPVWQDVISLMLKMEGIDMPARSITISFAVPESVQPRTKAEIREIDQRSGIALVTILRREGWSQPELDQLIVDQKEEREARSADLAQGLMRAQRRFDNPEEDEE